MAKQAAKGFDLRSPEIKKSDILIVKDENFKPEFVCLVTGAASGIGRATALAMAANRVSVAALDLDEKGGKETVELAKKLGRPVATPAEARALTGG